MHADTTHTLHLYVRGMHCPSCPLLIEQSLHQEARLLENLGISSVQASLADHRLTLLCTEPLRNLDVLNAFLQPYNFAVSFEPFPAEKRIWPVKEWLGAFVLAALFCGLYLSLPEMGMGEDAEQGSLALPLMVGFGASLSTCLALVGSIVVAFAHVHSSSQHKVHLGSSACISGLFQLGRLCSFFLAGGLLGFAGSQLIIHGSTLGMAYLGVAVVLTWVSLHMLGLIDTLFACIPFPRLRFLTHLGTQSHPAAPFFAGACTFLLPCGFAVSMMLLAVQTQSFTSGGLIMLFFALGTLPVLFFLGLGASLCNSPRFGLFRGTLQKALGLVILLFAWQNVQTGLMFMDFDGNILSRLGQFLEPRTAFASADNTIHTVEMRVGPSGITPRVFTVKAGEKVRWLIQGDKVSYCSNAWIIPKLSIKQSIATGESVAVNFTVPDKPGTTLPFSCWMGMIRGVFVIE